MRVKYVYIILSVNGVFFFSSFFGKRHMFTQRGNFSLMEIVWMTLHCVFTIAKLFFYAIFFTEDFEEDFFLISWHSLTFFVLFRENWIFFHLNPKIGKLIYFIWNSLCTHLIIDFSKSIFHFISLSLSRLSLCKYLIKISQSVVDRKREKFLKSNAVT